MSSAAISTIASGSLRALRARSILVVAILEWSSPSALARDRRRCRAGRNHRQQCRRIGAVGPGSVKCLSVVLSIRATWRDLQFENEWL
jgi:hypothetical protein